jgi:HNH endonuclease
VMIVNGKPGIESSLAELEPFAEMSPSPTGRIKLSVGGLIPASRYSAHVNDEGIILLVPIAPPHGRCICLADECTDPVLWADVYCEKHGDRFKRGQSIHRSAETRDLALVDALRVKSAEGDVPERFWDGFGYTFQSEVGPCRVWKGHINPSGYGLFRGKLAHRQALIADGRILSTGEVVDHKCGVKSCIRLSHLEVVSQSENARRACISRPLKSHCKWGHPLVSDNFRDGDGRSRRCKQCAKERLAKMNSSTRLSITC